MFLRPCFLVVDREFAGSISTRKLVLETAKFNVLTAYNYREAIAMLERFPNVDAAVITTDRNGDAESFLNFVREEYPAVKRVLTGDLPDSDGLADRRVESFSPDKLLQALRELFPETAATLLNNEIKLEKETGEA